MSRKKTDYIVVHGSGTVPTKKVNKRVLEKKHRQIGFLTIGYHYVIEVDGTIESGRSIDEVGMHLKGFNERSIGICMIGGISKQDPNIFEKNFTQKQMKSLASLINVIREFYPMATVVGHNDLDDTTGCPGFNVYKWFKRYEIKRQS